ncbi:hypothetical protein X975_22485, partial [Stegodyphus mimosarum]
FGSFFNFFFLCLRVIPRLSITHQNYSVILQVLHAFGDENVMEKVGTIYGRDSLRVLMAYAFLLKLKKSN